MEEEIFGVAVAVAVARAEAGPVAVAMAMAVIVTGDVAVVSFMVLVLLSTHVNRFNGLPCTAIFFYRSFSSCLFGLLELNISMVSTIIYCS